MINLIPNEEKKKKVKDFYFRLIVVSFFVLATSLLIGAVALVPAFMLSNVKKNSANAKLETGKTTDVPKAEQEDATLVKDLNNKLSIIEKNNKNKYVVSEKVFNEILTKKMPDIKITEISYGNDMVNGKTISVYGGAPSRDRLLMFERVLAENPLFKKVDLPISNFVKGSDIQFSLNIIPY